MATKQVLDLVVNAVDNASDKLNGIGKAIGGVGKIALGLGAAGIGAVTAAIVGSIVGTVNWANSLDDLGDVLGTTANESAAIVVALKPFGGAADDITSQIGKLAAGLVDAKGEIGPTGELMQKMGIQFKSADGKILPAVKLMENIANKIATMPDGLEKTTAMMDLFGKSGKGMSDAMSALTTGGLEEARKKAEAFGLTIGDDGVASTLSLQKGMADLELAGQGLAVTIGGPLLNAILPLVQEFARWAVQVMPGVRAGLGQVTGQIGTFVQQAITALQGMVAWVQTNWPAIRDTIVGAFNTVMSVVGPIFSAIQSVVMTVFTVIRDFLQAHGAEIAAFIQGAWTRIQGIISGVVGILNLTIVPIFQAIAKFLSDNQETIGAVVELVWNGIKMVISNALTIIEGVIKIFTAILKGDWAAAWQAVKDTVVQVWQNIMDYLGAFPAKLVQIGKDIITGIIKGITDAADQVVAALLKMLNDALDAVKAFFGIKSPSKVMAGVGFNIAAGLARGITSGAGLVNDAMGKLGGGVVSPTYSGASSGSAGAAGGGGQMVAYISIGGEALEPVLARVMYRSQRGVYA